MNRRQFTSSLIAGGSLLGAAALSADVVAGEVELTAAAMPPLASPAPVATPAAIEDMYQGEISDLWNAPWDIGSKTIEIGITIVQRFIGTEDQGYALGLDGLVFQSVIYARHGFQQFLFIGVQSDLSRIEGARTLIVTGTYGGVQHNTDSNWEDPILVAHHIQAP